MNATAHNFGTSQIPFSFDSVDRMKSADPKPGDAVWATLGGKRKRAIVTHVDAERDNPRGDLVLCVVWCDSGRDGILFGNEVEVHFLR